MSALLMCSRDNLKTLYSLQTTKKSVSPSLEKRLGVLEEINKLIYKLLWFYAN